MKPLRVTNIQRGCVYDGPGVRTTVFLKGCTLKCPWCCNPETISFEEQWFVDDDKCLFKQGKQSKLCEQCERLNGFASIRVCPFGVSEKTSKDFSVVELFDELLKDKKLFEETGGGVTFSGGEPLCQASALVPLLIQLKKQMVTIAVESTLVVPTKNITMVIDYVDTWIIDVKIQPEMFLSNADYIKRCNSLIGLLKSDNVIYRLVFLDNMMEFKCEIASVLKKMNISKIELLPCHNLGSKKYNKLYMRNAFFSVSTSKVHTFSDYLNGIGFYTNILSF